MSEISVLVPVYNEENFIESFYHSFSKQKDIFEKEVEIIFIDGGSSDATLQILESLKENNDKFNMKILHNAKKFISPALNMGLIESTGEILIRLDVHSTISEDYISRIYNQLSENSSEYCNFGGRTNAKGYDRISLIISKALSNKWVIGGAQFRFSKKRVEVDTLFPGAWLRKDLVRVGGWDESWLINEDVELNCRLRKITNKKIILDPDIVIDYHPRNNLMKLGIQYFNYGYWRIKTANKHGDSIRIPHLIPLVFLFIIVLNILFMAINMNILVVINIAFYLLYLSVLSLKIFGGKELIIGMATIFIIQFTWILGAFKGYVIFGFPLKNYYLLLKKVFQQRVKLGSV